MTTVYIVLGILLGVPLYLMLNWVFLGISCVIGILISKIMPGEKFKYMGMNTEWVEKLFGWFVFLATLILLVTSIFCRLAWALYHLLRIWFKLIKRIWWNFDNIENTEEK